METIEDEIEMIKCRQLEILKAYKEVKKTYNVFERGVLKKLNEIVARGVSRGAQKATKGKSHLSVNP